MGLRETLRDELRRQAGFMGTRVPVYVELLGELLDRCDDDEFVARLETVWANRTFSSWYDRPLLILAALHFDSESAELPDLREALELPSFWHNIQTRSVQTNEASRAVAWLWTATLLDLEEVVLIDLGWSAGLNLVADALDLSWAGPDGPLFIRPPRVIARIGYDLKPGDVRDEAAMAWLRACVWPGETARLARLEAAITAARAAVDRGDLTLHAASLPDVPARLDADLGSRGTGSKPFLLAYQTIVRDYLSPADQAAYREAMIRWLSRHEGSAAWVELEHDPRGAPCVIELHRWRAGKLESTVLGTCGAHPEGVATNNV